MRIRTMVAVALAALPVKAVAQNAFSNPTQVDSPACEKALHDMYDADEVNKYTGQAKKIRVKLNYAMDLHNNFFYGGQTIHQVVFEVDDVTPDGVYHMTRGREVQYCILDKDGSVLGIERDLRKE